MDSLNTNKNTIIVDLFTNASSAFVTFTTTTTTLLG